MSAKPKAPPPLSPSILALKDVARDLPPDLEPPAPDSPRGRILTAARILFAEHGFAQTSTRAVAEQSGVNLAMIHYYFGSKERLYERVLAQEIIQVFRQIFAELPSEPPPEEVLLSFPLRMLALMLDSPLWAKLLRREVADGGAHLKQAIRSLGEHGPLKARDIFMAAYRQAVREGRVRDLPPDAVRELLITIGFSAAFIAPLMAVFEGRELSDEKVQHEWRQTISTILRSGLLIEPENRS